MPGVVLGRAGPCAGAVAAAAMLACPAGPAIGKASTGARRVRAARLSQRCAYQNSSVSQTPAGDLRAAVVCLIDRIRERWHLPPVHAQAEIERAAQNHTGQMVALNALTHFGGSDPGTRVSSAGYRWSALGEVLASGYPTPRGAVAAWLASGVHCPIMLSPMYRAVGVGVLPAAVSGVANVPGTWTADFGLRAGHRPPSANWGPANSCPH